MRIFIPTETDPAETRVPIVPDTVSKLVKLGAEVGVESGIGAAQVWRDEHYREAGAAISQDRAESIRHADMVLRLRRPPETEVLMHKRGAIHISFLDPFNDLALVKKLAEAEVSAISMEMVPRSTIAQKMDALSSQANLAGYAAVILAAAESQRIFPMMMTPAGTISPSRVFVIGVGVAGLQAIATAKRLGARVEAFDTRPVVEEQVRSLGAKFVKLDLGETGQTEQGYAKALTPEQLEKQRQLMARHCATADVVITTAQVFGKKAPVILTTEMVRAMRPGSVAIDLAVETGGNVECSKPDEEVDIDGVRVIGFRNMPGRAAIPASEMYSGNLGALIAHFWSAEEKAFRLNLEDDLIKGCLITHGGEIVNETIRKLV